MSTLSVSSSSALRGNLISSTASNFPDVIQEIGPSSEVIACRWSILTPSIRNRDWSCCSYHESEEGEILTIVDQPPSLASCSFVLPILCGRCRLNKQLSNCPTIPSAFIKSWNS